MDTENDASVPAIEEVEENRSPLSLGIILVLCLLLSAIVGGTYFLMRQESRPGLSASVTTNEVLKKYTGKKILYIDSYHEGYEWSDGLTAGIEKALTDSGAELRIIRMDTKRNAKEEWKLSEGARARNEISAYKPDVVIASDDNAFKYVIQAYYRDADLPVVFAGLNWDASGYGAPYKNTTGMIEVSLTTQIIDHLKPFAKGSRLGYLSADTETERKNLMYYEKLFGLTFEKSYFVKDMDSWKNAFLALQKESDLIIFENNAGISGWDDSVAEDFATANIKVPVGTTNSWTMKESVLGITKIPNEQGEWAGATALRILDGATPDSIPLVKNEKGTLIINLVLAEKLGIVFSPNILKNAVVAK